MIASFIWATSYYTVAIHKDGWLVVSVYFPQSKLLPATFRVAGWKAFAPFTHWCWILLGVAFTSSSAICLVDGESPRWLLRLALVSWEIAAPCSFLVSAAVTYSIIPDCVRGGADLSDLFHPRSLIMHNINALCVFSEICLLGGLPITVDHIALAPLFGCIYVIFAWSTSTLFVDPKIHGPQFFYNFMDTTIGWMASAALVALLIVLMIGYFLMVMTFTALEHLNDIGGGTVALVSSHMAVTLLLTCLVGRLRP